MFVHYMALGRPSHPLLQSSSQFAPKFPLHCADSIMKDKAVENPEVEARRLKTLAEQKYSSSNLKSALKYARRAHAVFPSLDGLSELLTSFQILRVAANPSTAATFDWYKILQIEPFSHTNAVKKQYKKLALTLHPDKNPFPSCEEAFKLVAEAFRVLSDKIRRKEYDMRLRIAMQSEATEGVETVTFWTACSACRLLHKFERKYLGRDLMCPSCEKSFKALEVSDKVEEEDGDGDDGVGSRSSDRIGARVRGSVQRVGSGKLKRKMSSVEELLARSKLDGRVRTVKLNRNLGCVGGVERSQNVDKNRNLGSGGGLERLRNVDEKEGREAGVEVVEKSKSKRAINGEETMTLAEMRLLARQKLYGEKKKKRSEEDERATEIESEKLKEKRVRRRRTSDGGHWENERWRGLESGTEEREKPRSALTSGDSQIMVVEDSDFYNFDKDRMERSFKTGQVWAIYDDDDGMPRHYGLIDDVVSVNPFEVRMSWLDFQTNGDEGLICWEKMGIRISCGRFKVARKAVVNSVNIFSHIANAERAARELFRIYPKKGSVWALYRENDLGDEPRRNPSLNRERCYDIVVFLTSYSEIHGLSMAYLEKVGGFKTVFKRKEIGCHAIRWLEKEDVKLFSHQIPARKLSGEEAADLSKDCWELDPASLPTDLLTVAWHK